MSETEANDEKIGMIKCHLEFKHCHKPTYTEVTGTLIHPRIVLTCAHFLNHPKLWENEPAMIVNVEANQSIGFELWLEHYERRYFVRNMTDSSPFKYQGLQNGDFVTELMKWDTKAKIWENCPLGWFRHGYGTSKENLFWKLECYRINV